MSHCWKYDHLLVYQLSSLVLYPPQKVRVCVSVYYSPADRGTEQLLEFFGSHSPRNVEWNWCPVSRGELFRRSIGRNRAALTTQADWIWFTDCDQVFREDCLDRLAMTLSSCRAPLVFPREVACTRLLEAEDDLLRPQRQLAVVDIDASRFEIVPQDRANGASQIVHGDVARQFGYCRDIPLYQRPVARWAKAREDRLFRWLVGSQGQPVDVPGVYRIEHLSKGRADGPLKKLCRRFRAWHRGLWNARTPATPDAGQHDAIVLPHPGGRPQVDSHSAVEESNVVEERVA